MPSGHREWGRLTFGSVITEHFAPYARLTLESHLLPAQGKDAESVRDGSDPLWEKLSADEPEKAGRLSQAIAKLLD